MKKVLALLLSMGFLFACNTGSIYEKSTDTDTSASGHHVYEEKITALVLNNGTKWKADSTTFLNAALLQSIVSNAKKENLENYLQTSAQLENGLNKTVTECKMKGADHEALHQWLEPLMVKTRDLKKANSLENAEIISGEIEKQIKLFPQYFEK
jgi:hypothetical protein